MSDKSVSFLPRIGILFVSAGGHLFDSKLLSGTIGFDPLPAFRVIFAELAIACKTLSEAIAHAGKPEVFTSLSLQHPCSLPEG